MAQQGQLSFPEHPTTMMLAGISGNTCMFILMSQNERETLGFPLLREIFWFVERVRMQV